MQKVKNLVSFKKTVRSMAQQKNAKLFHCYVAGDIFKIATAKKVQQFDFSHFGSEKEIIKYIATAIEILRKELPQQILLFDEICNSNPSRNGNQFYQIEPGSNCKEANQ
jgi:adenylyl- and sulfurtransferase ThiI